MIVLMGMLLGGAAVAGPLKMPRNADADARRIVAHSLSTNAAYQVSYAVLRTQLAAASSWNQGQAVLLKILDRLAAYEAAQADATRKAKRKAKEKTK
jgi:hypothetical protein